MLTHHTPAPARPRPVKGTPRPRNRKAQILAVARDMFGSRGYHQVSLEDIATEVGITAGALYRHFPNKPEILAQTILSATASVHEAIAGAAPQDSLDYCRVMIRFYVDNDFGAILVDRDTRHLAPERRREVRTGVESLIENLAGLLTSERRDLGTAEAMLLSRALTSITVLPARHRSPAHAEELLAALCDRVRTMPLHIDGSAPAVPGPGGLTHSSRRETLLRAASRLIRRRGYRAVTMEDIGAEAGMASSSIYTYFDSKTAILRAILTRGDEALRMGLAHALDNAVSPEDALDRLVRSYVRTALAPTNVISILVAESIDLPEEVYATTRAAQREYIDEWVGLLGGATPENRATVLAAIGVVNDLTRISHLRALPGFPDIVAAVALRVLGTGAGADGS